MSAHDEGMACAIRGNEIPWYAGVGPVFDQSVMVQTYQATINRKQFWQQRLWSIPE